MYNTLKGDKVQYERNIRQITAAPLILRFGVIPSSLEQFQQFQWKLFLEVVYSNNICTLLNFQDE